MEVLINGEVRKAEFFKEYVQYEAAKNFCEESKSFLPKQLFRILQPSFLQEKIFWLAENEVWESTGRKAPRFDNLHANKRRARILRNVFYFRKWYRLWSILFLSFSLRCGSARCCRTIHSFQKFDNWLRSVHYQKRAFGAKIYRLARGPQQNLRLPRSCGQQDNWEVFILLFFIFSTILSIYSGFNEEEYSPNKTGIEWCINHPAVLSPGRRLRHEDQQLLRTYIFSMYNYLF